MINIMKKNLYFLFSYNGPLHTNNLNGSFFYILDYFLFFLDNKHLNINPIFIIFVDEPIRHKNYITETIKEIIMDRYEGLNNLDDLDSRILIYQNPTSRTNISNKFKEFYKHNRELTNKEIFTNVEVLNDLPFSIRLKLKRVYCQHTRESVTKLTRDSYKRIFSLCEKISFYNEQHKHLIMNKLKTKFISLPQYAINMRHPRGSLVTPLEFKQSMEEIFLLYGKKPIIAFGDPSLIDLEVRNQFCTIYNTHPKNFFSLFDTYIDVLFGTYDYSPRMILECKAMGKRVLSIRYRQSEDNRVDGNDKRFKNLDRYTDYEITENDKIIRDIMRG